MVDIEQLLDLSTLNSQLAITYLDDTIQALQDCIDKLNKALGNVEESKNV